MYSYTQGMESIQISNQLKYRFYLKLKRMDGIKTLKEGRESPKNLFCVVVKKAYTKPIHFLRFDQEMKK